jgi:hypothetical protein
VEYILLCWAIHTQHLIDKEFRIQCEIYLVTITWFVCNSAIGYAQASKMSLEQVSWINFVALTTRSSICILIAIYNSGGQALLSM